MGRHGHLLHVTGTIVKYMSNAAEVFPKRINIDVSTGVTEMKLISVKSYALGGFIVMQNCEIIKHGLF